MTTDADGPIATDDARRGRRVAVVLAAGVLAALLLWFGRAAWGGWWVQETSPAHDTQVLATIWERWALQVRGGHLPLWFPEFAGGYPVHSAWMYGILYPPLLVFTALPVEVAWTWLAILHIVFGALGMYAWLWEERRDAAAAATAAIVFAFSGFVLGRVLCGHLNLLLPFTWVPWTMRAVLRTARGERGAAAVLGLTAGIGLLAGHVQIWFYAAPLAAAYGLFEARRLRDARAVLRLATGALLALGIAAIQWLPAWEMFDVSGHPAELADLVGVSSAPGAALLGQLAPRFATFDPVYGHEHLGLAGPLAVVAVLLAWRTRGAGRWFWITALAFGLVVATGPLNPVGAALNEFPPFRWSRVPGRALSVVVLAGSVLAGRLVADWFAASRGRVRVFVPIAFLVSALAFGLAPPPLARSDFHEHDWLGPMPAAAREHRLHPGLSRLPYLEVQGARTLRDVCPLDTPGYKAIEQAPPSVAAWWFDVLGKIDLPWVPTPADETETAALVARGRFVEFAPGGAFHVYDRADVLDDADALARMRAGDRALHLAPGEDATIAGAHVDPSAVTVTRAAPDRIDIAFRAPFAGWVVLSEKWYPGWKTTGPSARVVRANLALLAVRVEPGTNAVTLVYRPGWFAPGMILTGASLLAAVVALLRRRS